MSDKKGNLHKSISQGICGYVFFTKMGFKTLFKNKNVEEWIRFV